MEEHGKLDHFFIFIFGAIFGMGIAVLVLGMKVEGFKREALENNAGGYNVKTGEFEFKCQH